MTNVVQINPAASRDLAVIVERIARFKATGLTTFQAMACSFDESDWDRAFAALRAQAGAGAR